MVLQNSCAFRSEVCKVPVRRRDSVDSSGLAGAFHPMIQTGAGLMETS